MRTKINTKVLADFAMLPEDTDFTDWNNLSVVVRRLAHTYLDKPTVEVLLEYTYESDLPKVLEKCTFCVNQLNDPDSYYYARMAYKNKLVSLVDTTRGAPMGRYNFGAAQEGKRVFNMPVHLNDGYDKGGAYWGLGKPLRVEFHADLSYYEYYRVGERSGYQEAGLYKGKHL
jgi:hypothetical protein